MQRNLYASLPAELSQELLTPLVQQPGLLLERIVSLGQATPKGEWCHQERAEWVILLRGRADLSFESPASRVSLQPGDYLLIPPGTRHRVEWTDPSQHCVWLALHFGSRDA